ncbi:MAG TPA: MFS transporter [Micromonosporaceae bacterium]
MPATGNLRAVLRGSGFRRLLGVRLLSQFADGFFQGALAGSVLFNPERQTSPLAIAGGFAVLLLPYSLIGPYVGVFLDRWSRRSILYLANLIRMLLVLPAAVLLWYGREDASFILITLLVIGINRFFLAGLSAAQPHVVDEPRLVTANALATTLGTVVFSIGLGAAGVLATPGYRGYATIAGFASLGYLASALLAHASFSRDALGPDEYERRSDAVVAAIVEIAVGMVQGIRHLAARRSAAYALLAQSAHRMLYGVLLLTTVQLYRQVFYPDDPSGAMAGLAQIVVVGGAGALAAAFITPPVTRRIDGWRWITGLMGTVAITIVAFGLPFRETPLLAAVFVINVASQGTKIVVDTALQRDCDDEYRGRVFSVNDTAFNLNFVIGMFVAVQLLPASGRAPLVLIGIAAGYALLAVGYGMAASRWHSRSVTGTPVDTAA